MLYRALTEPLQAQIRRGKSILLLGARQTGKTTLLSMLPLDLSISLMKAEYRQRYERTPQGLSQEILAWKNQHQKPPLVFIDEIQLVPALMNEIQWMIDQHHAQFLLCGSSARKLKHQHHVNLLPGRVRLFQLHPLSQEELDTTPYSLEDFLYFGSLPAIVLEPNISERERELKSYVEIYLETEVRREALVRNLAHFGRFLELAASQSGEIINLTKLAQEIGVAHTTIQNYYQILEDCLIATRIEPFTHSKTRRKLVQSPQYLFFDLGVRRLAAKESQPQSQTQLGRLFEQWIGLELLKLISFDDTQGNTQLLFWRAHAGIEVDWILKQSEQLIPIGVKWTDHPTEQDVKYLKIFLTEYQESCRHAYLVCRTPVMRDLGGGITALPYQDLPKILKK